MIYWVTTDTHFGHNKLVEYQARNTGFEDKILKRHSCLVGVKDVLIHLGDFCIGKDEHWHREFMINIKGVKWLVRGNHDKKSISWYLDHGWDFVGDSIEIKIYGKKILFSHSPKQDIGYDLNIHGHFHDDEHRKNKPEFLKISNEKQKLIMLEHDYKPITLKSLAGQ